MAAKISENTNSKLGNLIHGWAIPAGKQHTCPGESHLCRTRCYAKRGFFRMPSVEAAHAQNLAFSVRDDFVSWMSSTLVGQFVRVIRVHVAGDFYDSNYVNKWQEISKQSPQVQFFAYTRAWRKEEMLPALISLAGLHNFQLWWSIDRETGPAPVVRGIRRAYMAINDVDAAHAPDDCDLVFRDHPTTVLKKANGIQVCPPENGVNTAVKLTCSHCGICWNRGKINWEQAMLPYFDAVGAEISAPLLV